MATKTIKAIDQIILNENLDKNDLCTLLEVKQELLYNDSSSRGLNDLPIYCFYNKYITDISRWINQPVEEIKLKIENKNFSELENKLIIINILLKESEDKVNDPVY